MCGIAGILGGAQSEAERQAIVRRMTATLVHRGPDGEGYVSTEDCSLGFRRLAIVDVEAASPPYANEDGSIWSVANAEIYNAPELRADLESDGHRFHTGVDTEILTHLYEKKGIDFVDCLNGMFAFALWDTHRRLLLLARDRTGEKPLFYWRCGGELVFASELRALLEHPRVSRALDPVALRRYLLHDFFPAPLSPIAGIRKLPAGKLLVAREDRIEQRTYWDLATSFADSGGDGRGRDDLVDELDARIALAVERRRRSDVPIGVYLSGGIDSSIVLAHVADQAGPGVPVFSLGHTDLAFDESRFARDTARYYDAEFHQIVLTEADLSEGLRLVGEGFDEPLGDASTIPSHLLARFARERVKVVLSGEGADELFAGYPTYLGHKMIGAYGRLPAGLRGGLLNRVAGMFPVKMGNVDLGYLLKRFADGAGQGLVERHHSWFGSFPPELHDGLLAPAVMEQLADDDPLGSARERLAGKTFPDDLARLLYSDFTMYLQDDLLTKVDRATMLVSLEARAPFLDHDLAEFVAGLPSRHKVRGLTTKDILRRAARRRLPRQVLTRRKRGFNIPFARWLLHGLGKELSWRFSEDRIRARGLFKPAGVQKLLEDHMSRVADHRKPLFTLLALDLWCDRTYGDGAAVPISGVDQN